MGKVEDGREFTSSAILCQSRFVSFDECCSHCGFPTVSSLTSRSDCSLQSQNLQFSSLHVLTAKYIGLRFPSAFFVFILDFTDVIKDVANIDKAVLCCQVYFCMLCSIVSIHKFYLLQNWTYSQSKCYTAGIGNFALFAPVTLTLIR